MKISTEKNLKKNETSLQTLQMLQTLQTKEQQKQEGLWYIIKRTDTKQSKALQVHNVFYELFVPNVLEPLNY